MVLIREGRDMVYGSFVNWVAGGERSWMNCTIGRVGISIGWMLVRVLCRVCDRSRVCRI